MTITMPSLPHIEAAPLRPIPRLLEGQKALVTGASSGIGKGVAMAMAAAGADVCVNYPVEAEMDKAAMEVDEIRAHGGHAFAHQCDVSKENEVAAMFDRIRREMGTCDILVANAGIQRDGAIHEMSLAQWNRVLDVNLTGQFLCCREAIREFRRRGFRPEISRALGKIICMSSVHEVIPWAGHVNYAASKGGVMLMMKSIAQEVAPQKIRVFSIAPGAIRTPINRDAWETPEAYAGLMKLIPAKRIGETEDIARAAVWLASDEADYITGTTLFIDGGMTLYPGFEAGG
jgi:glucose 1-dehydrogenase